MANLRRDAKGRVVRNHEVWSLESFNDGYATQGRMKVYLPGHPRASPQGYVLRSIAAYEAYHGTKVPLNMEVHHRDVDPLNDTKENLVLLPKDKHLALHRELRAQRS